MAEVRVKLRVLRVLRGGRIAHRVVFCRLSFMRPASPPGRELSKLAIAWQAATYGSDPVVFTPELMASVTDSFLQQKVKWSCALRVSQRPEWPGVVVAESSVAAVVRHRTLV